MQTCASEACKPTIIPADPALAAALDRDGYALIPGVLDAAAIAGLRRRLAELHASEGDRAGLEVHQEAGTDRLANLVAKGGEFLVCLREPRVLGAVDHVLAGDWRLSALNSRTPVAGAGRQGLHADWGGPPPAEGWQVCNSVWLLDDMDPGNGATRIVPGSHRWMTTPAAALADPAADHPQQVVVSAPAGSVLVFNSHCWHGGTLNASGRPRRAVFAYFTRRQQPQQTDQRAHLPPAIIAGLEPAERWVLDV